MTWREEIIGDARLILADCRDVLPTLAGVDAVVTDPVWPNCPPNLIPGSDDPDGLFADFCAALPAGLRQLVVCIRNDSDPRILRHVPSSLRFQQVAWCQYVMPGYLGRVLGGNECAYVFGTPVWRQPGRMVVPSVSPKAQPDDRPPNGHPCSRALVHQEWLVHWFSDVGETVCDPFMGSGTAGVAATRQGRHFVGIEIHEPYFDIACRRIEEATKQGDLIRDILPKPEQKGLEL
jgi:site-specific DNA-methyltransferase (adenine-specific)